MSSRYNNQNNITTCTRIHVYQNIVMGFRFPIQQHYQVINSRSNLTSVPDPPLFLLQYQIQQMLMTTKVATATPAPAISGRKLGPGFMPPL